MERASSVESLPGSQDIFLYEYDDYEGNCDGSGSAVESLGSERLMQSNYGNSIDISDENELYQGKFLISAESNMCLNSMHSNGEVDYMGMHHECNEKRCVSNSVKSRGANCDDVPHGHVGEQSVSKVGISRSSKNRNSLSRLMYGEKVQLGPLLSKEHPLHSKHNHESDWSMSYPDLGQDKRYDINNADDSDDGSVSPSNWGFKFDHRHGKTDPNANRKWDRQLLAAEQKKTSTRPEQVADEPRNLRKKARTEAVIIDEVNSCDDGSELDIFSDMDDVPSESHGVANDTALWMTNYDALLRYGEVHGTCNVPFIAEVDVGGKGEPESIDMALKPGCNKWNVNVPLGENVEMIETCSRTGGSNNGNAVVSSVNIQKKVNVMPSYSETVKLGHWLDAQRKEYSRGTLNSHRTELLQQLVECGLLKWQMRVCSYNDTWDQAFGLLLEYNKKHGHCNVPFKHSESISFHVNVNDNSASVSSVVDEPVAGGPGVVPTLSSAGDEGPPVSVRLGQWLYTQRQYYKKKKLRADRMQKLQQLVDAGQLKWEIKTMSNERLWEKNFEALLQYGKEHNHYNVPFYFSYKESTVKLGKWLDKQRQSYKSGMKFLMHISICVYVSSVLLHLSCHFLL